MQQHIVGVAGACIGALLLASLQLACGGSSNPANPTPAPNTFQVTSVATSVDSPSFVGTCPHRFTFTGTLTVNLPGTVTYRWEKSDSTTGPPQSLTFATAGSQTQVSTWDVGSTSGGWMRIRSLGPNEIVSNQATFQLNCNASEFAVTAVSANVDSSSYTGTCPHRLTFNGSVTANGAGSVTYRWDRSDGTAGTSKTLTFTAAGAQAVSDQWDVAASVTNGWSRLHVLAPNELNSNQAAFSVTCR